MATVERSITIEAPLREVFEYMDYPPHQAEISPSIVEVENVERLPNGGSRSDWVYKMVGVRLRGSVEAVAYEPNERIVFDMRGSIEGQIRWEFKRRSGKTEVVYHADYTVPVPRLGEPLAKLASGYNEREVESTLANLKARMEDRDESPGDQ